MRLSQCGGGEQGPASFLDIDQNSETLWFLAHLVPVAVPFPLSRSTLAPVGDLSWPKAGGLVVRDRWEGVEGLRKVSEKQAGIWKQP